MNKNEKSNRFEAFGARLKFLREQWQQSLQDVSSTLEIDKTTLQEYESGIILPAPEILDMLISHFLLTEDQANDLRELAEEQREEAELGAPGANIDDILAKQLVMVMPMDHKVIYTDSMQATVNDNGVVLQFMQQAGQGQQPIPVSRVGMSRQHAERVIRVLQDTLRHHDQGVQKKLPSSDNNKPQSK